jgi:aminoglycoside phosphotransferase family enzyme/predicted kinase
MNDSAALVERLARVLGAEVLETHISWVLLCQEFAYKVKKPVRLPFVDYSTLERRLHFCQEEVRLNRRLAPTLYLGVSSITGTADQPAVDGSGEPLEYAVRMRRFPAGALFSEQLESGTLQPQEVDRLADLLARCHASAPRCAATCAGAPSAGDRALAAIEGCRTLLGADEHAGLRAWIGAGSRALQALWNARRAQGKVRDCHGDLHLANIVSMDGEVAAFDCIEFDPALRWIDILDDAAFALMDFAARGRPDLGWRFINGWLERTGEYEALPALRFSVVHRALVRAQVEHLRAPGSAAALRYARLALTWSRSSDARLVITHGLPGSGKTFASQQLLERQGAVRIRSDVERKRLFGLRALDDSRAAGLDLYTTETTGRAYARLFAVARQALQAGYPVVLDAAFLRRDERQQARALAEELHVPFAIVACDAPLPVLRQRLLGRQGDASEADLAVLEKLAAVVEPLQRAERAALVEQAGRNP